MTRSEKQKHYEKHGGTGTRLHNIWRNMLTRCNNQNNKDYKYYGAKGVCVCNEWRSFINFRCWALANGYAMHLTIDRVENAKGYQPDNCRWATMAQQNANKCKRYYKPTIGE